MKALLLLSFLFSFNTFADFVKLSDFNSCDVVGYYDKHTCEKEQSSECVKLPSNYGEACGLFQETLQDVFVDDLEKPIRDKTNVTVCEGQEACQLALESLECEEKYIDSEYTEAYCSKVTGYEQKFSHKIAVIDEDAKSQRDAQRQAEEQEKALEAQIAKRMECGNKTIIEASKMNAKKEFTNAQVMAFSAQFADIANLLKLGATDSANELIQAATPNELISQEELNQLSSFLTSCVEG